jgi:hypothetical protein
MHIAVSSSTFRNLKTQHGPFERTRLQSLIFIIVKQTGRSHLYVYLNCNLNGRAAAALLYRKIWLLDAQNRVIMPELL